MCSWALIRITVVSCEGDRATILSALGWTRTFGSEVQMSASAPTGHSSVKDLNARLGHRNGRLNETGQMGSRERLLLPCVDRYSATKSVTRE